MWDEFQFTEHGGRRTLPRPVNGFVAGGGVQGTGTAKPNARGAIAQALDLSPGFGDSVFLD